MNAANKKLENASTFSSEYLKIELLRGSLVL
jgi:hypothetical protein